MKRIKVLTRKSVTISSAMLALIVLLMVALPPRMVLTGSTTLCQDVIYQHRRLILVGGMCSSDPRGEVFAQMVQWLKGDMGYRDEDIIPFSYSSGWDGFNATYDSGSTANSIHDSAALMKNIYNAFPGEEFDIVGFSLGGVVSLYAMAEWQELRDRTHTVLTIDSPVAGIREELKEYIAQFFFTCREGTKQSIEDLDANPPSDVISTISTADWKAEEVNVVTLANTADALLSPVMAFDLSLPFPPFWEYPSGEYGVLANADRIILEALTGEVDYRNITQATPPFLSKDNIWYYHSAPKNVESEPAGQRTKQIFIEEVILKDLNRVFVGTTDAIFAQSVQQPNITTSNVFTHVFIGNQDAMSHTSLTEPSLPPPQPLTRAFVGNQDAVQFSTLSPPSLPVPLQLSKVFIGNDDAREYFTLNVPFIQCGDATGDGSINALDITRVERVIAGLDPYTSGADANGDGSVNALDITKVERLIAGLG